MQCTGCTIYTVLITKDLKQTARHVIVEGPRAWKNI